MKNILKQIFSVLLLMALLSGTMFGQQMKLNKPELYKEKIALVSDRTIYAAGEQIQFKAYYAPSRYIKDLNFSNVLYVELIKPDGTPILQEKFPLNKTGSIGTIDIPSELLTGNYYLKSYTKWMRNFDVATYAFNRIQIFNATNSRVYSYNSESKTGLINYSFTNSIHTKLTIETNKKIYNQREKVQVNLSSDKNYFGNNIYSVSVVKKGVKEDKVIVTDAYYKGSDSSLSIKYYPEPYGLSLSGKVKAFENPKEYYEVNIGSLNGLAYFSSCLTKKDGIFNFNLPGDSGLHELFISVNSEDQPVKIELDNAFCEKPLYLEQPDVMFTDNDKLIANQITINKQIADAFQNPSKAITEGGNDYGMNFYGTGNKMLYIKDFIELPYIEDFLFELVPEILVRHQDGEPSINFTKKQTLSNYPVLILLDNIVIYDKQAFLKIPLQKIKSIEIIDNGYVVGDNKFSGILSAVSNNGDMAGIELPKNAMFIKYELFSKSNEQDKTVMQSAPNIERIPDRRNCLYWNPEFIYNLDAENSLSFYTTDVPGDYEVVVQTFDITKGQLITTKTEFKVE